MSIHLKEINQSNWLKCTLLEVTPEQKEVFPVPVVYWLAESAYRDFYPLALYSGQILVGFSIYALDPEDHSYWIMAFLIDKKYQGKGLGKAAMKELISFLKTSHHCNQIKLGHRPDNKHATKLYESLGFKEVEQCQTEVIRNLILNDNNLVYLF